MATKIYLPSSSVQVPTISPTVSGSWGGSSSNFARVAANVTGSAGSTAETATGSQSISLNGTECYRQFICPPFNANTTISGTVSTGLNRQATTFTNSLRIDVGIRVIQSDGSTVRGTPLALTLGLVYAQTASKRSDFLNATALSSVSAQTGDFLIIEIGLDDDNGADSGNMWFGDNMASDLSFSAEEISQAKNPTVSFSGTFLSNFGTWNAGSSNQLMMTGMGV